MHEMSKIIVDRSRAPCKPGFGLHG